MFTLRYRKSRDNLSLSDVTNVRDGCESLKCQTRNSEAHIVPVSGFNVRFTSCVFVHWPKLEEHANK